MFALLAMIVFVIALVLDLVDAGGDALGPLLYLGLALLAAYFAIPITRPWRREP